MQPTLLVLAAGMGSRYGGIKQIDAVGQNGETLLDFGTYDAKKCGFGKVVFIIRKDIEKDFRERLFDRIAKNFDAEYVFQEKTSLLSAEQVTKISGREKPWGTIHAVLCAEQAIKTPFAVINSDDYYGRQGFETIAKHLCTLSNNDTEHAMVAYELANTMSKNGTVSRGIPLVKDGYLVSMREHTKIGYEDGKIISRLGDEVFEFTGKEPVSMNFFGFTPKAFEGFHIYWDNFIAKNLEAPRTEALLPEAAGLLVSEKLGKLKVYTSGEQWFGMTYSEDRENVKKEIAAKIKAGYYPEILWDRQ